MDRGRFLLTSVAVVFAQVSEPVAIGLSDRRLRVAVGLTQAEAAERLGVTRLSVARYGGWRARFEAWGR